MTHVCNYRDVNIYVGSDGVFHTREDSAYGQLSAKTLSELKKKIDSGGGKIDLKEITGLMLEEPWWTDDEPVEEDPDRVEVVKVTSLVKRDNLRSWAWIVDSDGFRQKVSAGDVYADTPHNRLLLNQWLALRMERRRLEKQLRSLKDSLDPIAKPEGDKA